MVDFNKIVKEEGIDSLSYKEIKDLKVVDSYSSKNINENTMFSACSISKLFTVISVLIAKDEGLIELDKDINYYLKNFVLEGETVRIKDLLLQQSGLVDSEGSYDTYNELEGRRKVLDLVKGKTRYIKEKIEVKVKPRIKFIYSDNNMLILELLLQDIYNLDFRDIIYEKVLKPLKMKNSKYIDLDEIETHNFARGRDKNGNRITMPDNIYPYDSVAGLWTTTEDLSKLMIDIFNSYNNKNDGLLKKETAKEMFTTNEICDFAGYGVFTYESRGKKVFHVQGWGKGFQSYMMGFLEDQDGVVIMMNQNPGVEQMEGPIGRIIKSYIDNKFS